MRLTELDGSVTDALTGGEGSHVGSSLGDLLDGGLTVFWTFLGAMVNDWQRKKRPREG